MAERTLDDWAAYLDGIAVLPRGAVEVAASRIGLGGVAQMETKEDVLKAMRVHVGLDVPPEPEEAEAPAVEAAAAEDEPTAPPEDLDDLTVIALRERVRDAGIPGARDMRKDELIAALRESGHEPAAEDESEASDEDE